MSKDYPMSLENFFAKMESDADAILKELAGVTKSIRQLRIIARQGALRDLGKSLESSQRVFTTLKQQLENAQSAWHFDNETYFSTKQYHQELQTVARSMGLTLHEAGDKLYCYPAVITVNPKESLVRIDRKKESGLRPSYLIKQLKELIKKPRRSKPEDFLESLFSAYLKVSAITEDQFVTPGPVVPLVSIHELLTLLPGIAAEYNLQEFARDIYMLDHNRVNKTKKGFSLDLPASTALKSTRGVISAVTPEGDEKRYYGLRFLPKQTEGAIR